MDVICPLKSKSTFINIFVCNQKCKFLDNILRFCSNISTLFYFLMMSILWSAVKRPHSTPPFPLQTSRWSYIYISDLSCAYGKPLYNIIRFLKIDQPKTTTSTITTEFERTTTKLHRVFQKLLDWILKLVSIFILQTFNCTRLLWTHVRFYV